MKGFFDEYLLFVLYALVAVTIILFLSEILKTKATTIDILIPTLNEGERMIKNFRIGG